MGILDAPLSAVTAQQAAVLTFRLQMNNDDAVLAVLGDSTGNNTDEWVYLLTQAIATQYPAYTVNYRLWNDGGQVYDSAVVIQTGSGSHILDVYNCSVSGETAAYPLTRWSLVVPSAPQLVMTNYGHNNIGITSYRAIHYPLTRGVQERWPSAGIICSMQNPRGVGDTEKGNDLIRQRQLMELCASEGYGCVNVTQAFLNTPSYTTALTNVDLLHPNAAGSIVWANEIIKHFRRSTGVVPSAPHARQMRLWVPPAMLEPESGGITRSVVNTSPALAFDSVTQQGIITTVDLPDNWASWDIYAAWSHVSGSGFTGANNGVQWELARQNQGASTGFLTPISATGNGIGSMSVLNTVSGFANNIGSAYGTQITLLKAGEATGNRPIGYRLRRLTADAADVMLEPANLLGLIFVRAS